MALKSYCLLLGALASAMAQHPLTPNGRKAGSAGDTALAFWKDHLSWWHDWTPAPSSPKGAGLVPVSMLWGGGNNGQKDAQRLQQFEHLSSTPAYVMGFNEPDCSGADVSADIDVNTGVNQLVWANNLELLNPIATSWIQTIYYGLTIRAGDPKPAPGSPRFNSTRRNIHVLVVTLYLAYTIYKADYELRRQGSFYTDLGVPFSATDRDVKSRFRRLTALHHPDKTGSVAADSASYFIHLKAASDTLQDAAKRFAYERFSPKTVAWQKCVTIRDFITRGVFGL